MGEVTLKIKDHFSNFLIKKMVWIKEFIQGPGETIYMPGNLAHAIMNIEENISVTENYFLEDSLEDWSKVDR